MAMNPFELNPNRFLLVYLALFQVALLVAAALRWLLRSPGRQPKESLPVLGPYEAAYLAGGETLAVQATLACLLRDGNLYSDSIVASGTDHERSFLASAQRSILPGGLVRLRESGSCEHIHERLQREGLLLSEGRAVLVSLVPMALLLGVSLFALAAILVGMSHDRPVGLLAYAFVVSLIVAVAGFGRTARRSRRGDQVLEQMRREHADLGTTARRRVHSLSAQELILAVGLFGPRAVSAGPLRGMPVLAASEEPAGTVG
jgi:uncharacterized protein (TIGR04222 family)